MTRSWSYYKAPVYGPRSWARTTGGRGLCAFDFAVNSGPARAIRYLQAVSRRKAGWHVMGPATLSAVNAMEQKGGHHGAHHCPAPVHAPPAQFSDIRARLDARVKAREEEAQRMAAQPPRLRHCDEFIPEVIAAPCRASISRSLNPRSIGVRSRRPRSAAMTSFAAFDWKVALPIVLVAGALGGWII